MKTFEQVLVEQLNNSDIAKLSQAKFTTSKHNIIGFEIHKAVEVYVQQFIDAAEQIIQPANDILPETYEEDLKAWDNLIKQYNQNRYG